MLVGATVSFLLLRSSDNALALGFSPGQTIRYRLTISMDAKLSIGLQRAPIVATTSADAEWRVLSVDPSGTATVVMSISNATVTSNGSSQALPPQRSTFQLTSDGRLLSPSGVTLFSGGPAGGALGETSQLSALLPPDGSATPGDTWTKQISQSFFGTDLTFTQEGSYLRNERIGSTDAAVIEARATIPMDFSIKASDLVGLIQSGASSPATPTGASLVYSGQVAVDTTSWIDTGVKQILKTSGRARFSIGVLVTGNATAGVPPGTSLDLSGSYSMTIERR